MKAKVLVFALLALILTTIHLVEAQQAAKVPRILVSIVWLSSYYDSGVPRGIPAGPSGSWVRRGEKHCY
jgi:hypothetical protein